MNCLVGCLEMFFKGINVVIFVFVEVAVTGLFSKEVVIPYRTPQASFGYCCKQ